MKKRIMTCLLIAAMLVSFVPTAYAVSTEAYNAAGVLNNIGLFKGTGTKADGSTEFDLGRAPARDEAVTMLVRLLGKETEAKNGTWNMPFTDVVEWAKPYVGYAYANGLTSGTSATTFGGSQTVTATQYLTFVLRALGYDSSVDFAWDKAWELSDKIGMTDGEYKAGGTFLRGDVAIVSRNALDVKQKDKSETLAEKLIKEKVFTKEQYKNANQNAEVKPPVKIDSALLNAETRFGVRSLHEYLLSLGPDEVIFGEKVGKPLDKYRYEGVLIGDKIGKEIMSIYNFPSVAKNGRFGLPLVLGADKPVSTEVSCNVHPNGSAVVDIFQYTGDGLTYAVTYYIRNFTKGEERPPITPDKLPNAKTAFGDTALHKYIVSMNPDAVHLNGIYPDVEMDIYWFFDDSVVDSIVSSLYDMYDFVDVCAPINNPDSLDGPDGILRPFVQIKCCNEGDMIRYLRITVVDENGFGRTTDYIVEFVKPE